MSFSSTVREELTRQECAWPCCARSEINAAILTTNGISLHGLGQYRVSILTEHNAVVRYYFALLKRFYAVTGEVRAARTMQLGAHTTYQLQLPDESVNHLLDALLLRDTAALFGIRSAPAPEITAQSCCRVAFLKSAFLCAGSVANPEHGYHLEIAVGSEALADFIMRLMNVFELGAKISCRKSQFVVYLKGVEQITTFLTIIGAHAAVLSLENTRIVKDIRNNVNRQANCDSNNIERAVTAAQTQIAEITFIEQTLGLGRLPQTLREIAEKRVLYPQATFAELGELLNPPLGKSGVNSRLRRIQEIAAKLRDGNHIEP